MQGATGIKIEGHAGYAVSIHAPYAGSDAEIAGYTNEQIEVSIHAPYAGSDHTVDSILRKITLFQSTPPMQGATVWKSPGTSS